MDDKLLILLKMLMITYNNNNQIPFINYINKWKSIP